MLIDSNLIIYAAKPEHSKLRSFLAKTVMYVSVISYVEVLGYHQLTPQDKRYFELFFTITPLLPLVPSIVEQAIELRQTRKMGLGDALIASTALVHQIPLATHNRADFSWITDLQLIDPLE